jgi:hypothetical protein
MLGSAPPRRWLLKSPSAAEATIRGFRVWAPRVVPIAASRRRLSSSRINAVIGLGYDASEMMQGVTDVLCYGTAVIVSWEQTPVSVEVVMRLILSLALSIPVALAGRTPLSAPLEAASSKVWVGHYGEYERFLRTAVIDRARGTTQRVFFMPGGLAESGAVHRQDYKGEIAGYKFDRVLNLDMVPPTVEKNVDGVAGSLALWVLNTRPLRRIDEGGAGSSDPAR